MSVIETVGVVVFKDDAVLLVRHRDGASHKTGAIGLPAGKIDSGESAPEAAARELYEETGLEVAVRDLVQLPKTYTAIIELKQGIKTFHWTVFIAKEVTGSLHTSEETVPFWLPLAELDHTEFLVNTRDAIRQAIGCIIE